MVIRVESILSILHLQSTNLGCSTAGDKWFAHGNRTLASVNPTTGDVIGHVASGGADDFEKVMLATSIAYQGWRAVPAPKRGECVRLIGDRLRQLKDPLGSLVALEMGKSKQEGDGEVQEMIDMADYAVGLSRMLHGKTMPSERVDHRMYEQWMPIGPVGVISAFNFPVAVWSWNAFIAAVCGNTVVWKPSPKTPLCAIAVQHICNEVMEVCGHPGVFSLFVTDEDDLAKAFVNDRRFPLISFTGSTPVGRLVNESVAKRLGRCLLELSGNNAMIIAEDANLELAIPAIVFGAVGTAGQRCTTTRRLLIHESIYDTVVEQLRHAYSQILVGDPLDVQNLMGPLCEQSAVDAFVQTMEQVRARGDVVLSGGNVIDRRGFFVEPTLVAAQADWEEVGRETFAPILYLMKYNDLNDAIAMHNSTAHGLSSAIFTQNVRQAERFLSYSGSDCGIANVNIGTSGAEIGGAFGGEKDTGGGREAGSDAWKAYMRRQTVTINWSSALPLAQGIEFNLKS